jgi:hypothetical protein
MTISYNMLQTIMLLSITDCYLDESEVPLGFHQKKQQIFCAATGWRSHFFVTSSKESEKMSFSVITYSNILNQPFNQWRPIVYL